MEAVREPRARGRRAAAWALGLLALAQLLPPACDRVTPNPPKRFGEACPKPGISQCYLADWQWWGYATPLVRAIAPELTVPVSTSRGYVEDEVAPTPPADTFRMIAVGGSTTMSSIRSWRDPERPFDHESYVKHLARAARAGYRQLGFEGLAFATSGWNLPETRAALEQDVLTLAADLVLVGEPVNWLSGGYYHGPMNEPKDFGRPVLSRATAWNRFNIVRSVTGLASLLRLAFTVHGVEESYGWASSQRDAPLPGLDADLEAIHELVVERAGVPLALVVFGSTFELPAPGEAIDLELEEARPGMRFSAFFVEPDEGNAAIFDLLQAYNRRLRAFAASHEGVLLIDADAFFQERFPSYRERTAAYESPVHLTDTGKDLLAAELLLPALRQLVPDVPRRELPPLVPRVAAVEGPDHSALLAAIEAQQSWTGPITARRTLR